MAKQLKVIKDDITSVEKFEFEPIKGFPMLNWKGKRPFRSTQYYPAQLKEIHGEEVDGWLNEIYWGDNLQVMSNLLKKYRGKIKLIYIDPPFDSKADYKKTILLKGEKISNDFTAFEEKQYGDIWTNDEYLQFLYERFILLKELLSDDGSIYVHCDWHKNHYIRCLLDEVFGQNNFLNEIIWQRSTSVGSSKAIAQRFPTITDTIWVYVKDSEKYCFNKLYTPPSEDYKARFNLEDENGKYYWNTLASYSQETYDTLKKQGRVEWNKGAKFPRYKTYLHELKGSVIPNIWTDINMLNSMSKERQDTNYPTQKPEELLSRIIKASSLPGDIVMDCFMGSGTTQAVSLKMGRKFIGADINLGAVQTSTKRLINLSTELKHYYDGVPLQLSLVAEDEPKYNIEEKIDNYYTGFAVYNVNNYDIFRNPLQAKELLIEAFEVQPYPNASLWDGEKDGRKVKIMPINRIATKADLNEIIANIPWKEYEKKHQEAPTRPVDKLLLICMGHEPDLAGALQMALNNIKIEIEVVDILRDKANLEFKRDSEAKIEVKKDKVVIKNFYPMNLLQKLSLMKKDVEEWRELVDSVMIDFNYDGAVFTPTVVDVPEHDEMVEGEYEIPEDAGNIKIKITDLLSEAFEKVIEYGNQ